MMNDIAYSQKIDSENEYNRWQELKDTLKLNEITVRSEINGTRVLAFYTTCDYEDANLIVIGCHASPDFKEVHIISKDEELVAWDKEIEKKMNDEFDEAVCKLVTKSKIRVITGSANNE